MTILTESHSHTIAIIELNTKIKNMSLKDSVNYINKHVRCLSNLGQNVKEWDSIIVPLITSKLDSKVNHDWNTHGYKHVHKNDLPTFEQLVQFLLQIIGTKELDNVRNQPAIHNKDKTNIRQPIRALTTTIGHNYKNIRCPVCNDNHFIYSCEKFKVMPIDELLNLQGKVTKC